MRWAIAGSRLSPRRSRLRSVVWWYLRAEQAFPGVERAYAVQAGREIRVLVENRRITDEEAVLLSRDIAHKIESEMTYPGQIKVTVIRETRVVQYAR